MKYTIILIGMLSLAGCTPVNPGPPASTACQVDSLNKVNLIDTLSKRNIQLEAMLSDWKAGKRYQDRTIVKDETNLGEDSTKLQEERKAVRHDERKLKRDEKAK